MSRPTRLCLAAICLLWSGIAVGQEFVPGVVVVRFRAGLGAPASAIARIGGTLLGSIHRLNVAKVGIPRRMSVEQGIRILKADPSVVFAEPDYVMRLQDVDDPDYPIQWDLPKVLAPQAWGICKGAPTVSVAVLDTGADLSHPELVGKILDSYNFTGFGPAIDRNGHGTHTAGIVAANTNNGTGIASLGYASSLLIGKVATDQGTGDSVAVAEGIEWATSEGAKVISMSLGTTANSSVLADAVEDAWNQGVVLVAAAGNGGTTRKMYPGAYEHCIAVAATDPYDRRCSFSSYGSWVHVSAPGQSILSLSKNGGYAVMTGTSMAAPHVAALAALLWADGGRSNLRIRTAIETSGDPVFGFGSYPALRINARRALLRFP